MKSPWVIACLIILLTASAAFSFDKTTGEQGVNFRVQTKDGSLMITPTGLIDNKPVSQAITGEVIEAESGDLNSDGSPEIYVYIRGKDKKVLLIAYSANNKKSLTPIFLPELTAGQEKGRKGPDEYAVVEGTFARRFPLSGGKYRQIQYQLKAGETGWVLKVDRVMEF